MPILYLRTLTGKERSQEANRHLAMFLAFIAGATNAGGFLAVRQYTSHMSRIVSAMADNSALGNVGLVLAGLSALASFVAGAALTALGFKHLGFASTLPLAMLVVLALVPVVDDLRGRNG